MPSLCSKPSNALPFHTLSSGLQDPHYLVPFPLLSSSCLPLLTSALISLCSESFLLFSNIAPHLTAIAVAVSSAYNALLIAIYMAYSLTSFSLCSNVTFSVIFALTTSTKQSNPLYCSIFFSWLLPHPNLLIYPAYCLPLS